MDVKMVQEWERYLKAQNERAGELIAVEADPEVKAHYEGMFADGNRMLSELDGYRQRLTEEVQEELVPEVHFAEYVEAAFKRNDLTGAAKELNAELKLPVELFGAKNHEVAVPWSMLEPRSAEEAVAMRGYGLALPGKEELHFADTVTTLTSGSGNAPQNREAISPYLFKNSIMGFLGVQQPSVAFGEYEYPYVSAVPTAGAVAEGSGSDAGAIALTVRKASLKTVDAGVLIGKQSLNRYGASEVEGVIRTTLQGLLMEKMNDFIINGSGSSNQPKGILSQINSTVLADGDTANSADDTAMGWADINKSLYAHLSDPTIMGPSDLRFLLGLDTFKFIAGLFRSNTGEVDGIQKMREMGAAVAWSGHMPAARAATGNAGQKQAAVLMSNHGAMNVIAPTWEGFSLLYDPYSPGANHQVAFRAYSMFDIAYRRSTGTTIEGVRELDYVLTDKT